MRVFRDFRCRWARTAGTVAEVSRSNRSSYRGYKHAQDERRQSVRSSGGRAARTQDARNVRRAHERDRQPERQFAILTQAVRWTDAHSESSAILGAHSSPCECRSSTGPQNRRLLKPLLWTAAAHQFGENCRSRKAGGGHVIRLRQSRHQTGNRCTSRFTNPGTRLLSRPPYPPPAHSIRGVGDLPGIAGHLKNGM
jgi:hypothetical protein